MGNRQFDDEFIITDFLFVEKMHGCLKSIKYYGLFYEQWQSSFHILHFLEKYYDFLAKKYNGLKMAAVFCGN